MQVQLQFQDSDFENMRAFEKAVKRQLGNNVYVGCNSLCLYFGFPKEFSAKLRPFAPKSDGGMEVTLESSLPDAKK